MQATNDYLWEITSETQLKVYVDGSPHISLYGAEVCLLSPNVMCDDFGELSSVTTL